MHAFLRLWFASRPLALAALLAILAPPASAAEKVALTFDDLPTLSLIESTDYMEATTRGLLRGLTRHHLPATGFVTELELAGPDHARRVALLTQWLDAGMDLGNHGYSHKSLNKTPVEAYIADVERGEHVTKALLAARGRTLRWYRHPYLETGRTPQIRARFESWLASHGYRVAPVTVENADWVFAEPYDDAVQRGDKARAAKIRHAYLSYTAKVVPWYQRAARQLLHRRPALVFLLHATRLNADSIDAIAAILKRDHLRAVTLDQAMRDPAYRIHDIYVGPEGEEWLTRWSEVLKRPLPWDDFPDPPDDMAVESDRLEAAH